MSDKVQVDSDALRRLRTAILRFSGKLFDALSKIDLYGHKLTQRLNKAEWHQRESVRTVRKKLDECNKWASVPPPYRPSSLGLGPSVDCYKLASILYREEEKLNRIVKARQRLDVAMERYNSAAVRLRSALQDRVPMTTSFLERRITAIEAYHAMILQSTALALAATGLEGMMEMLPAVLERVDGKMKSVIGSMGEEVAAQVLSERYGLRELPFDQPKHGFDRVLTAPGIPLIVLESKTTADGGLRLGDTTHGEQGSAEWVADKAAHMTDRRSAQWSPANERIGQIIQELGPENVPVLAVVTGIESGLVDIYYSGPDGVWSLLEGSISISENDLGVASDANSLGE